MEKIMVCEKCFNDNYNKLHLRKADFEHRWFQVECEVCKAKNKYGVFSAESQGFKAYLLNLQKRVEATT